MKPSVRLLATVLTVCGAGLVPSTPAVAATESSAESPTRAEER